MLAKKIHLGKFPSLWEICEKGKKRLNSSNKLFIENYLLSSGN